MFRNVEFADYNGQFRLELDRSMAQFYANVFSDQDYFGRNRSLDIDNRYLILSIIDGMRIGWQCAIGHHPYAADTIRGYNLDLLFSAYPHPEDLGHDRCKPFSPLSFGFDLVDGPNTMPVTWDLYRSKRSSLIYRAEGNSVLFCQKRYFGFDEKCRQPLRGRLLKGIAGHTVDFDVVSPERYLNKIDTCKVAVLGPGVGPQFIDRANMQLMALGCCVISPVLTQSLPNNVKLEPGVHYIPCADDYSDIEDTITSVTQSTLVNIGRRARDWFEENFTPRAMRRYVRDCISKLKTSKYTIDKTCLELTDRQSRCQRHIDRYRFVRQFCSGVVVDYGCGTGYGSAILRENPRVTEVVSYDPDQRSNTIAAQNFGPTNQTVDPEKFNDHGSVFVCLEVLEHLDVAQIDELFELIDRCGSGTVIFSVPDHPTAHYNPEHKWDWDEDLLLNEFRSRGFNDIQIFNKYESFIVVAGHSLAATETSEIDDGSID